MIKSCNNCLHRFTPGEAEPCAKCKGVQANGEAFSEWQPMTLAGDEMRRRFIEVIGDEHEIDMDLLQVFFSNKVSGIEIRPVNNSHFLYAVCTHVEAERMRGFIDGVKIAHNLKVQ